ncbi:hypothetical protein ONA23_00160 [Mycoplasmopsis cynos]|uniref:hypothetical protein n=1 Tax=Mycoplasmopsis cynos TaxID=171284 RepID=UPI0024C9EE1D|nr:hypothetical protein [Mycoplasmopsis cynos]WAM06695.1 hypothetical protein ONA23_00160 [Mycoplasmopsis cynos]
MLIYDLHLLIVKIKTDNWFLFDYLKIGIDERDQNAGANIQYNIRIPLLLSLFYLCLLFIYYLEKELWALLVDKVLQLKDNLWIIIKEKLLYELLSL